MGAGGQVAFGRAPHRPRGVTLVDSAGVALLAELGPRVRRMACPSKAARRPGELRAAYRLDRSLGFASA
jgi:ABC-type transporter Mla MlaB component